MQPEEPKDEAHGVDGSQCASFDFNSESIEVYERMCSLTLTGAGQRNLKSAFLSTQTSPRPRRERNTDIYPRGSASCAWERSYFLEAAKLCVHLRSHTVILLFGSKACFAIINVIEKQAHNDRIGSGQVTRMKSEITLHSGFGNVRSCRMSNFLSLGRGVQQQPFCRWLDTVKNN
ncbi:hypothetical protein RB195_011517 [Necator americanus]|uniref:Uncharacterized protein n=1 Tax=Necator americanus TaxID=51031 RepID=A0ABR1D2R7_NECAM